MMLALVLSALVFIGSVSAKRCMNLSVPVTIKSRNAVFGGMSLPVTDLDATTFIQNVTQQGQNFTATALTGYADVSGTYNISAQFCVPSSMDGFNTHSTVQILTHGIGFDKTYWDSPYDNYKYSYVDVATDQYNYCTLSYDRLGIGNSCHGEPLNEIQSFLEIQALASMTNMLRAGNFPGVNTTFKKVTHVGHSFGSAQTYSLVNLYPHISDGIVLTGFSMNASYVCYFGAGANFVQANLNQPFRFGNFSLLTSAAQSLLSIYGLQDAVVGLAPTQSLNYPAGYLTNANINSQQYLFFLPGYFDRGILELGEATKQPVTPGELLTLGSLPITNAYAGPVLVITGSNDLPYCGGDCLNTGDASIPSIPSTVVKNFPKVAASNFSVYIQPHTGHGLNFHHNATGAYNVINTFLDSKGLNSASASASSHRL